ncbi:hypothetical protein [Armatimonas sp.]|uniref:hypothetical protein n=1 Tax=Armatimonas sp. TaxID=1872638 RepID=UPI00286A4EA5|nr:hypothetical protein [Armatimonas sp.]
MTPNFFGAPAGALAKTKARLSQENSGLQPAREALLTLTEGPKAALLPLKPL